MITAEALRQKIEAHREDGGDTEILELALFAFEAREALTFYADKTNWAKDYGLNWAAILIHKDCAMFNAGGGRARLALSKFPEGET